MKNNRIRDISTLKYRVTCLEKWGFREKADFQDEGVEYVKNAGYNAVLANGGSGFGPDSLSPEMLVQSDVIPDLMPRTISAAKKEFRRRVTMLEHAKLGTWISAWGVPGPQISRGDQYVSQSPLFFDRRMKLEMLASYRRSPELFGHRNPGCHNWRGDHPLCLSEDRVAAFYKDLYRKLGATYPEIKGVLYFPGDNNPEICDATCPKCSETKESSWERMVYHVNDIFHAMRAENPDVEWYFTMWNLSGSKGVDNNGFEFAKKIISLLDSEINIAMSMNDVTSQTRGQLQMTFEQPWMIISDAGELFRDVAKLAQSQGRKIIGVHEFSQSELFDPVCQSVPLPIKTLASLESLSKIEGVEGFLDFWGNHRPWVPHANHAVMSEYFARNKKNLTEETNILKIACQNHYSLFPNSDTLLNSGIKCWRELDEIVNNWPIAEWSQRFSPGIGRVGARGSLYSPLIPSVLKELTMWKFDKNISDKTRLSASTVGKIISDYEVKWIRVAKAFRTFSKELSNSDIEIGAKAAEREARTLEMAGSLMASEGRTIQAIAAWREERVDDLRCIIEEECLAREHQLDISSYISPSGGVNPVYVSEDIQNMRFFVASHDFPHTPDELFHLSPVHNSMACPISLTNILEGMQAV